MDYLEFYGFSQEPFSVAPVSKFYFNSAQHSRALVRLMYAVDTMKGLAVLIGDIGTGKTTLARRMLDSLPEEEYESALLVIIHSGITADWLLERIALQLGVKDPAKEKLKLLNQLYTRLMELYDNGKKAVVLIDEAQMLQSRQLMEEFRGLLNLELPERKLITFVFFGLPELEETLKLDPPLEQRVSLRYSLEPLNEESTHAYINHRIRLAGGEEDLFDDECINMIHRGSKGVPRLINIVCDNALFEGYLLKNKPLDITIIRNTMMDLGLLSREELKKVEEEVHGGQETAGAPVVAPPLVTQQPAPVAVPVPQAPAAPVVQPAVPEPEPPKPVAAQAAEAISTANDGDLDDMFDNLTGDDAEEVAATEAVVEAQPEAVSEAQPEPEPALPEPEPEVAQAVVEAVPEAEAEEANEFDDMLESLTEKETVNEPAKKQVARVAGGTTQAAENGEEDIDAMFDDLEKK